MKLAVLLKSSYTYLFSVHYFKKLNLSFCLSVRLLACLWFVYNSSFKYFVCLFGHFSKNVDNFKVKTIGRIKKAGAKSLYVKFFFLSALSFFLYNFYFLPRSITHYTLFCTNVWVFISFYN